MRGFLQLTERFRRTQLPRTALFRTAALLSVSLTLMLPVVAGSVEGETDAEKAERKAARLERTQERAATREARRARAIENSPQARADKRGPYTEERLDAWMADQESKIFKDMGLTDEQRRQLKDGQKARKNRVPGAGRAMRDKRTEALMAKKAGDTEKYEKLMAESEVMKSNKPSAPGKVSNIREILTEEQFEKYTEQQKAMQEKAKQKVIDRRARVAEEGVREERKAKMVGHGRHAE